MQTEWLLKAVTAAGYCCTGVMLACRLARSRADLSFSLCPPRSAQSDKTNYCLFTLSDIKPIVVSAPKTKLRWIWFHLQTSHFTLLISTVQINRREQSFCACMFEKSLLSRVPTIFSCLPIKRGIWETIFLQLKFIKFNKNLKISNKNVCQEYNTRSKCMIISSG